MVKMEWSVGLFIRVTVRTSNSPGNCFYSGTPSYRVAFSSLIDILNISSWYAFYN